MKAKITYINKTSEKITIIDYQITDHYFQFQDTDGNDHFIYHTNINSIMIFDKDIEEK